MSGPRLVFPHFDAGDADLMGELTEDGAWVHQESEARAKEEAAVPSADIAPMDYITMRRDRDPRG